MNSDAEIERYRFTSPCIYQNNVMSLSLVMTIQPWFMKLLHSLRTSLEQLQLLNRENEGLSPDLTPNAILEVLGYCCCGTAEEPVSSAVPECTQSEIWESKGEPHPEKEGLTDCCHSKSVSGKQDSEDIDHRKDDEYLLDIHPNEAKYFTNPKTGRKVKKLVCKVPGWGKVFEKKWNFKDHIRMHMGEKPYKCDLCDKAFTQKGNLAKHKRQHQFSDLKARKVHQCEICFKKFTEKYNLKVSA